MTEVRRVSPAAAQRRRAESARLIETAVELLASDPETNIQEIADASGVGRTTIYRNFAGREDLVEAALAVVIERSQQATGEPRARSRDPERRDQGAEQRCTSTSRSGSVR